jgi:hypothetical protein
MSAVLSRNCASRSSCTTEVAEMMTGKASMVMARNMGVSPVVGDAAVALRVAFDFEAARTR